MNHMRKKSSGQGGGFNNSQRHKQRFSQGGGQGHGHNHNRPRKNYSAMREKYLQQARDALAAGDRVQAENYFQHADHCFRMLAEEQANRPQRPPQQHNNSEQQAPETVDGAMEEEIPAGAGSALPAFLTVSYDQAQQQNAAEAPPVQDWEERDAS